MFHEENSYILAQFYGTLLRLIQQISAAQCLYTGMYYIWDEWQESTKHKQRLLNETGRIVHCTRLSCAKNCDWNSGRAADLALHWMVSVQKPSS